MTDAFRVADDVLRQAVQGISDLVMLPGLINLDFADVRTTMLEAGDAILGIGMGVGEHRAMLAAEKAVSSPLLDSSVEGAHSLLLSITGGPDLSLVEASEAAEIVQQAAHPDANIIFGASIDEDMHEEVWITVIATRFDSPFARRHHRDSHSGPSEPRDRAGDDRRDRGPRLRRPGRRLARGRRARSLAPTPRLAEPRDEIYGDDLRGRGQDRRPTTPRTPAAAWSSTCPSSSPGTSGACLDSRRASRWPMQPVVGRGRSAPVAQALAARRDGGFLDPARERRAHALEAAHEPSAASSHVRTEPARGRPRTVAPSTTGALDDARGRFDVAAGERIRVQRRRPLRRPRRSRLRSPSAIR